MSSSNRCGEIFFPFRARRSEAATSPAVKSGARPIHGKFASPDFVKFPEDWIYG
jgi:hypothetical protein